MCGNDASSVGYVLCVPTQQGIWIVADLQNSDLYDPRLCQRCVLLFLPIGILAATVQIVCPTCNWHGGGTRALAKLLQQIVDLSKRFQIDLDSNSSSQREKLKLGYVVQDLVHTGGGIIYRGILQLISIVKCSVKKVPHPDNYFKCVSFISSLHFVRVSIDWGRCFKVSPCISSGLLCFSLFPVRIAIGQNQKGYSWTEPYPEETHSRDKSYDAFTAGFHSRLLAKPSSFSTSLCTILPGLACAIFPWFSFG